jgi:hypothetical protein
MRTVPTIGSARNWKNAFVATRLQDIVFSDRQPFWCAVGLKSA